MTNEERGNFYMKKNVKLSPVLIALTWDVFFFWTISTLFLSTVKGLTNSQIIALDSILMASGCILCIPTTKLFQDTPALVTARIGLLGYLVFLLIELFGKGFVAMVIAQPFLAFGYSACGIKINTVLTDSLRVIKRDKDYQRIYGKGMSLYYTIECLGAIGITYVYNWNPSAAIMCSIAVIGIAFGLTFLFKDPNKFMQSNIALDGNVQTEKVKKRPDSFFKILKSTFFVSMMVYVLVFRGVLSISGSSFKIYLNFLVSENILPIWLYGYIYAGTKITSALFNKFQFKFSVKFGVRTLIITTVTIISGFVLTGALYLISPTSIISVVLITIFSYIMSGIRTPNQIIGNNYLQVCTPKRNHERAHSLRIMAEYLGYAAISAVYAALLNVFKDNYGLTNLTYIAIFAIPLIVSAAVFIRLLIKKHAQKFTVIKDEYTND